MITITINKKFLQRALLLGLPFFLILWSYKGSSLVFADFESLAPDGIVSSLNYTTLNLTDIDEDPDASDGAWGTWDGNGDTSACVSYPTPTDNPTPGAGLQEFRVLIRKSSANGSLTTWSLRLYESGVQVSELATGTTTATDPGEVVSGTWDASSLGVADGSAAETCLVQTGGGTGGTRRGIEVGAFEWNVEYTVGGAERRIILIS